MGIARALVREDAHGRTAIHELCQFKHLGGCFEARGRPATAIAFMVFVAIVLRTYEEYQTLNTDRKKGDTHTALKGASRH